MVHMTTEPTMINPAPLSLILYCFYDVTSTGQIVSVDTYADEQKHYPSDSWSETGNNLYGNLKQVCYFPFPLSRNYC